MIAGQRRSRLSQFDAFFVAYQLQRGIQMQLGSETDLIGTLTREHFQFMLRRITQRWPQLGQRIRRGMFGLQWDGVTTVDDMLHVTTDRSVMVQWRNQAIDPFREPPLQVLWVNEGTKHCLVFRAHHSALDGEAFLKMCIEGAIALSVAQRGGSMAPVAAEPFPGLSRKELAGEGRFMDKVRYIRSLANEEKNPLNASTVMRQCVPGPIGIWECPLAPDFVAQLSKHARTVNCSLMWLVGGAWIKTLHEWNLLNRKDHPSRLSLEFPVSMRRNARTRHAAGNLVSPLTLFAEGTQTVEEIAQSLQSQTLEGIRKRLHFSLPLLSLPGKYLPWGVYRRIAVNQKTSGFATSHYSWFEYRKDPGDLFSDNSNGALEMITQRVYTPVCLHMGVALSAVISSVEPKLFITYRTTGFGETDLRTIADLLLAALRSVLPVHEGVNA